MAKKLPFVVTPRLTPVKTRIGTEDSGIFEIERRGYLTVAEKQFAQQASAGDEAPGGLMQLVVRIAQECGKPVAQVFEDMSTIEENDSYLRAYQGELVARSEELQHFQNKMRIITATSLMISRHDPEWTVADTMALHPDIVDGLNVLFDEEDKKCIEELEAQQAEKNTSEEASKGKE